MREKDANVKYISLFRFALALGIETKSQINLMVKPKGLILNSNIFTNFLRKNKRQYDVIILLEYSANILTNM